MRDSQSLSHVKWICKYHIVFVMTGLSFWAKGYCASTVALDEETIRKYIREQDKKH